LARNVNGLAHSATGRLRLPWCNERFREAVTAMPGSTRTYPHQNPEDGTGSVRPLTVALRIIATALCARFLVVLCATVLRP